jgi:RNA-directed DNA polymerase
MQERKAPREQRERDPASEAWSKLPWRKREKRCFHVQKRIAPAWKSKFEATSYGFRPGRSCHDAIEAIHIIINHKATYVLDADLKGCFDHAS